MKVKVITPKPSFTPIELTITIESEEELCDLWHRLNESPSDVNKNIAKCCALKYECAPMGNPMWITIDSYVIDLELKESQKS